MRNPWSVATALAKRDKAGKLWQAESPAEQQEIHPDASSTELLLLSFKAEQPQPGFPPLAEGSATPFQMISWK